MSASIAPPGTGDLQAAVSQVDWEQADADTRYLTHDLHRYSGKYIPQIARSAIELLTAPGDIVVDPYMGSGTTVLEAGLVGRQAVGIDINPLAVLIARVKTTNIPPDLLSEMVAVLGDVAHGLSDGGGQLPGFSSAEDFQMAAAADPRLEDAWFTKWFQADVLRDLLALDAAIASLPTAGLQALGRVALSNVLRKSSRAHSGYPNVMFHRNAPPRQRPGRAFMASLRKCVDMVASLPALTGLEVTTGDAARLPLDDGIADAVVTHPPYIGSVPYAEYGLLSLKWLGHDPKALDAALTGGRRQSRDVVQRFEAGYSAALGEWRRILRAGGGMFLMVGNPVVRGDVIDLGEMSKRLAAEAGFSLEAESERAGVNRRANQMGAEALLFFRSP